MTTIILIRFRGRSLGREVRYDERKILRLALRRYREDLQAQLRYDILP